MQPIHNPIQKFSSIVNVNESVGNSAHFQQNNTSSPDILTIVYTKMHQILKTLVERFRSFTRKVMFLIGSLIFHVSTIISGDKCQLWKTKQLLN